MFEQSDDFNMDTNAPQPPAQSNRTFIIVAGVLAGIVLLSIIGMALYAMVYLPQQKAAQSAQQATIEAQNAMIAQAMTSTMQANATGTQASLAVATTLVPNLPQASPTPLLAVPSQTQSQVDAAMTATWSAMNTNVALASLTPTATGGLPQSGFADDVGLPGLVVMAFALIVVILLARRMRTVPTQ